MNWIKLIEDSALTIVALIGTAGLTIRAVRQERQKIKDAIRPVVKEEIKPVETKVDTLLIADKYKLAFDEGVNPAIIIDTSSSKILSANEAFCKMVGESKETVEKERFLTYIDKKGLPAAKDVLDSMRNGVKVEGERINFKPDILGEIYATGNGNIYINIVLDKIN